MVVVGKRNQQQLFLLGRGQGGYPKLTNFTLTGIILRLDNFTRRFSLGDRLTAGLLVLVQDIGVRIPVPQPKIS